jgi:nicotinamidase-related amidase
MPDLPDKLQKDRSILILVDMQEKFRSLIVDMDRVVTACSRLIRFCVHLDIPILTTEHYPQGLGTTIPELQNLIPSFAAIEKITFSCGGDDRFRKTLATTRRDQMILCGIETHVCVYQTAFDLLKENHQVVAAVDAISSRRTYDREAGLARLGRLGADLMSAEMIMFEILKRAKTEEFKLVKDILKE